MSIQNKWYWLCPYCFGAEVTSRNWSFRNLEHTHFPAEGGISWKGRLKPSLIVAYLQCFDTSEELAARQELLRSEKKTP